MIAEQPDLFAPAAPKITGEEIRLLCDILAGRGWLTAAQICSHPEVVVDSRSIENAKRRIRAIANASGGQILSYPGSPGYRLTKEATIAEIQTAINKLQHQAKEMLQRAHEINRVYHAKL